MEAWYIESLDALGGRAFASYRHQLPPASVESMDADSLDSEPEAETCYFIGPPHFAPEPVTRVATALAATRGTFQLGLFDERSEIPFATLDDVAEFVRRAYISGGAGDGGAGGGGVPPAPPEGGRGPDEPDVDGGSLDDSEEFGKATGLNRIRAAVEQFGGICDALEPGTHGVLAGKEKTGASKDFWDPGGPAPAVSVPALIHAGRVLLSTLIALFPGRSDAARFAKWHASAVALGGVLIDTCVAYEILWRVAHDESDFVGRRVGAMRDLPGNFSLEPANAWMRAEILAALCSMPGLSHYFPYAYRGTSHWPTASSHQDRFERLYNVPIPSDAHLTVASRTDAPASLGQLLAKFLASPQIGDKLSWRQRCSAIYAPCLLAAASVVATSVPVVPFSARPDAAEEIRLRELTGSAWAWLAANLPRIALPRAIEGVIQRASTLRAGAVGTL
jgi:hypothetical protein